MKFLKLKKNTKVEITILPPENDIYREMMKFFGFPWICFPSKYIVVHNNNCEICKLLEEKKTK